MEKQRSFNLPRDGISISIPEGEALSRITLEQIEGGITLATVGSASASGYNQKISLSPIEGGITLALVGSASATTG